MYLCGLISLEGPSSLLPLSRSIPPMSLKYLLYFSFVTGCIAVCLWAAVLYRHIYGEERFERLVDKLTLVSGISVGFTIALYGSHLAFSYEVICKRIDVDELTLPCLSDAASVGKVDFFYIFGQSVLLEFPLIKGGCCLVRE